MPVIHLNIDQWGPAVEALVTGGEFDMCMFCEHRSLSFRKIARRMAALGYSCSYHDAVPTKALNLSRPTRRRRKRPAPGRALHLPVQSALPTTQSLLTQPSLPMIPSREQQIRHGSEHAENGSGTELPADPGAGSEDGCPALPIAESAAEASAVAARCLAQNSDTEQQASNEKHLRREFAFSGGRTCKWNLFLSACGRLLLGMTGKLPRGWLE